MLENTNKIGVLQKVGKTLHGFAGFIISPWVNVASIKPLERRIELLERRVYEGMWNKEESQDWAIRDLQRQIDFLQASTHVRLENIINYELRQQVLEVLKEQTYIIHEFIKLAVEDVMREQYKKKQHSQTTINIAEIQQRQNKFRQLAASIEHPEQEVQKTACIEAGQWLLTRRVKLAEALTNKLLIPQHPHKEEFCQNICKYLKLLGSCMSHEIEPRLLYKRVVIHKNLSIDVYLRAFQLLKNQYISDWESSYQLSTQAAEQLRNYFSYLIEYLLTLELKQQDSI